MKSLKQYIKEEGEGAAPAASSGPASSGVFSTPANTMGMGTPDFPGAHNGGIGSGDSFDHKKTAKLKRKKKHKKIC